MNQEKIGKFILSLRKKNNLTQKEFADKLNVTSQAVSKWENGRGIPDIEILKQISSEFNVDINDILNGEKTKKKKYIKYIIAVSICIISLICTFILVNKNHQDYEFNNIKSINEEFNIKGIAVYSSDKNSIYISSIEYKKGEEQDEYINMECTLYESHKSIDKKISQWGSLKNGENTSPKTLSQLLQKIEFKVEKYDSTCNNPKTSKLYINIKLLDEKNKITTYKIPLELTNCK